MWKGSNSLRDGLQEHQGVVDYVIEHYSDRKNSRIQYVRARAHRAQTTTLVFHRWVGCLGLTYATYKNFMSTTSVWIQSFEESFQKYFVSKRCESIVKKMKKTMIPKTTSKVLYELLLRSYEQFKLFSQTWNLNIDKNTNENSEKTKYHEKMNFSREKRSKKCKIQKWPQNSSRSP